jgi:Flp pilus assembly protein TadG
VYFGARYFSDDVEEQAMKNILPRNRSQRNGIAVIVTTLTLMLIIPMVGLAFDLSMLYLIKSRLLTALDGAVLAAARALGQGADAAAQAQNARTAAAKFFSANFAPGFFATTNLSFSPVGIDDASQPNYRIISGTASVDAPLYFMRIFGSDHSSIQVSAEAARRDALVELVLDRSSSMDRQVAGTGQTACSIMKEDAKEFIKYFAAGRDRVGLVAFNIGVLSYQSRTTFNTPDASGKTVTSLIDQIVCNSNTNSTAALRAAYDEILRVNSPSRANVIVFMTDGIPNGVTANFYPYRISPCGSGSPLLGVLAQWANNASSGDTAGLMNLTVADTFSDGTYTTVNSSGCRFRTNLRDVDNDIRRMPASDYYGNALAGPYTTYSNPYVPWFGQPADLTSVSSPRDITRASANSLDNQATVIRNDAVLRPMIYTIGLNTDPTGSDFPDEQLLRKIANDPGLATAPAPSPTFYTNQQNQTRGIYINAPDASQLSSAFETIATHIMVRLSK